MLINNAKRKGNKNEQPYIKKVRVLLNSVFNWMENDPSFFAARIVYSLKKNFLLLDLIVTSLLKDGSTPLLVITVSSSPAGKIMFSVLTLVN